jgi:hypothetical protein
MREFARKIMADVVPIPDGWNMRVVSQNGSCEWSYVKDFINKQIHGMSFERVSLLFGDDVPPGDEIMFSAVLGKWYGKEKRALGSDLWGRVVIRVGGSHFFVVRVNPEYVDRVRLLSAFPVSRKVVEGVTGDHSISKWSVIDRIIIDSMVESASRRR